MYEFLDPGLLKRLTAASHALPVEDALRDLADEVASWDVEGMTRREIDARIRKWGRENGLSPGQFRADLQKEYPGQEELLKRLDIEGLWKSWGYDEWLIGCVRSLAFTDEPTAFHPLAAGFWLPMPIADPPLLLAVMTPLSDPELASRQVKQQYENVFGKKAARKTRDAEVERARMLGQRRRGMSPREIAIQNLRDKHPDIVKRPNKYKRELETEKDRVTKALKAEVWKERIPESSTPE